MCGGAIRAGSNRIVVHIVAFVQWHHKLDMITTPDDIGICEAYIHFLRGSGDWEEFWTYLWEHSKLSKDDLSVMKGIKGPARHLPWLVPAVERLMKVIKITHSGVHLSPVHPARATSQTCVQAPSYCARTHSCTTVTSHTCISPLMLNSGTHGCMPWWYVHDIEQVVSAAH